jgi:ribosomal protein S18 acetylase RimI-like enzyme
MSIVKLAPAHAAAAARLHCLGQPGTFLTSLGVEVLTVLYERLPVTSVGFGFSALADWPASSAPAAPRAVAHAPGGDDVVGFVSATTGTGRLFLELGTRHLGRFVPPLVLSYLRQPRLVWRSVETTLYPWLAGGHEAKTDQPTAELLSIMVEPGRQSQGIGSLLLQALFAECRTRGVPRLTVTVDAANTEAQRFYQRHGFQPAERFSLYGRPMCGYAVELV